VTAVELLPIHAIADEKRLVQHGLRNYWGYSSIGYFAPEMRYSSQIAERGTVSEFKTMVKTLHSAGIEVILDVVYNHTGEGDHHGPTLSFRGIDNAVYYRLDLQDPRRYIDYTGTGNSLNTRHPAVVQLVLDSLRYWVQEMHVDGFRFDLATTLARGGHGFDRAAAFLAAVRQDPVLAPVKLIAEPWDIGEGGYQLGAFPPGWSEWNDKYRDVMRSYWKGDGGLIGQFAARLAGSADLFGHGGRSATASVNYVTAHDGFTLHDLVSYERKRNEANLEHNRDGSDNNRSWNCGAEGPTGDQGIRALREQQKRNFLATLMFSQGVPMLVAGDEMGRTQRGNNNAYCQDSELSWMDWDLDHDGQRLLEFARRVVALRGSHPLLSRRRFPDDIVWLSPQGGTMTESDWKLPFARCLGALLPGSGAPERDDYGTPVEDDDLLLLFNAHHEAVPFALPGDRGATWDAVVDTAFADGVPEPRAYGASATYPLQGRSLALLTRVPERRAPA
jgi:isoamylase